MRLEEGVRTSICRTPQNRARSSSEIKDDFEVIGTLDGRINSQRCGPLRLELGPRGTIGVLRRRIGPQKASRGGKQDL